VYGLAYLRGAKSASRDGVDGDGVHASREWRQATAMAINIMVNSARAYFQRRVFIGVAASTRDVVAV
jgi:hypothetical protein